VLQLVYFMAPAYAANMAPPLVRLWRGWNPPIHSRWLGSHKTVLGFLAGVLAALATAFAQHGLGWQTGIGQGDGWVDLGLRLGVGAMAGDVTPSRVWTRASASVSTRWLIACGSPRHRPSARSR
jgi:CDP-2,3-bis-(O-geranylgeranyl)-sn-glycerol synthase